MKSLEFLLAKRFLLNTREKSISSVLKICFFSIFFTIFSLTLIYSIILGLEKTTYEKLKGVHSDILISSGTNPINFIKLKNTLNNKLGNYIDKISATGTNQIIIKNLNSKSYSIVFLKAIDYANDPLNDILEKSIVSPLDRTKIHSSTNELVIGESLSKIIGLTVGQTIDVLFTGDELYQNKIILEDQEAKIGGIFKTGIHEFDESTALCSVEFFESLYPNGINQVNIKLKDPKDENLVIQEIKTLTNLQVLSWKDMYPSLAAAFKLEKIGMALILFLILANSIATLMALIYMIIMQKKKDIALLKILGAKETQIQSVFIWLALLISSTATACGILFSLLISFILNQFKIIRLPDIYYTDYLPAFVSWKLLLITFIFSVLITIMIALLATSKIKNINAAKILKYDTL